jgi:hypothetical protein
MTVTDDSNHDNYDNDDDRGRRHDDKDGDENR